VIDDLRATAARSVAICGVDAAAVEQAAAMF